MVEKESRVLHVIKGLGRGGAERLLISTISEHSKRYKFDVVYFLPWKNQLVDDIQMLGCQVVCLPSKNVAQMMLKIPALCRMVRDGNYDLIHAHLPWAGIVARIGGRITNVPVIYTEHNIVNRYNRATFFFHKLTFGWLRYVIAVSEGVEHAIRTELNPSVPLRTIANGVVTDKLDRSKYDQAQIRKQNALGNDVVIIGTVAVFTRQKRLDRWLRIADRVAREFPEVFFVIVGDGLLREELETQASALIQGRRLRFVGLSPRPDLWMACMDIYLMSSDFEGLPVALLEAMSMECVPVATEVGGICSVVDNRKNGFLYEPNDENSCVLAISSLIRDKKMMGSMGRNARAKVVSTFGIEKMVAAIEDVYEEVLQNVSSR
jgi:L-malate glycosyltransferase